MSAPFSASLISSRLSAAAPAPDLGVAAGAEAAGQLLADRELDVGVAGLQRLRVGVDGDELDAAIPASTMRLTALVPPPPAPTTLITAR
jgi:hypothetical protein